MNKQELARRLARRSRESRSKAADKLDALVYRLWKESRDPKPDKRREDARAAPKAALEKL